VKDLSWLGGLPRVEHNYRLAAARCQMNLAIT